MRLGCLVPLYLPPDKYVTGLFPSEVIIVLQYYFVSIPNNHPELISGKGGGGRNTYIHMVALIFDFENMYKGLCLI